MKFTFLTPEKKIQFDQDVEMVVVPAERGELQILAGHAPLVTTLMTGVMRWKLSSEELTKSAVVSWGYCQVYPGGIRVLADLVEFKEELSQEKSLRLLSEANSKLGNVFMDDETWDSVQRDASRARAELQLIG